MLTSLSNLIDFFKQISFTQIKTLLINIGLYLFDIVKSVWSDVKSNNGQSLMFFAWLLISVVCGFTFTILTMIVHACYVHHMQDATQEVCNHEDILKYTLVICLGGLLHCIF